MSSYGVHHIKECVIRAYDRPPSRWISIDVIENANCSHDITLFFANKEAFDQAVRQLNAKLEPVE